MNPNTFPKVKVGKIKYYLDFPPKGCLDISIWRFRDGAPIQRAPVCGIADPVIIKIIQLRKKNEPLRILSAFFLSLFCAGILFLSAAEGRAQESIRVLIHRDVSQFTVGAEELTLKDLATGHTLFHNRRTSSLTIERLAGARLRVRGTGIAAPSFLLASPRGFSINGRRFRDQIRVYPANAGYLWVVNILSREDYLAGLVNWEISSQWPFEAVKAQVVAARTYAQFQKLNRAGELFDVEGTTSDQVYGGMEREDFLSRKAVRETEGEMILFRGEPIFAVYHSCCGGTTESPEYLWAGNFPYLKSMECPHCLGSPYFVWNYQVDGVRLRSALNSMNGLGSRVVDLRLGQRSESRRILQVSVVGERGRVDLNGPEFRRLLGRDLLRSTNFTVKEKDGVFLFAGLGWGHGAGLCQWGIKGMAENGENYRSMLRYYYKNVTFGKPPG
jgi:stage II sporulation protein D